MTPPPWSFSPGRQGPVSDVILLEGLEVHCIVGVYQRERGTPQRLRVDLAAELDTRPVASGGGLARTVNYARVAGELRFLLESCRFDLLENAAEALARYLLAPPAADAMRARPEAVHLRLTKPDALGSGGGVPAVQVYRHRDEVLLGAEPTPFGQVDVLYESHSHHGIYRLRLAPGRSIASRLRKGVEESELVLGNRLRLQGRPVAVGTVLRWRGESLRRYDNPSDVEQTVLCVNRPGFLPAEEVEGSADTLAPAEGVSYYPEGEQDR